MISARQKTNRTKPSDKGRQGIPNLILREDTYIYRPRQKGPDGTRYRPSVTLGRVGQISLVEIAMQVARIDQNISDGIPIRSGRLTLKEAVCGIYLPTISGNATYEGSLGKFRNHVFPVLGGHAIEKITTSMIERWAKQLQPCVVASRKPKALAPATKNRIITELKAAFTHLHLLGYIRENPARLLKLHRENNQRTQTVREQDLPRLLKALADDSSKSSDYFELLLVLGTRAGELLNAKWSDICEQTRTLRLSKTKSGKPRNVPLSDHAFRILTRVKRYSVNDYLFPGRGDKPMSRPNRQFKTMLAKAGLEGLWQHDLRRTFSTLACRNGALLHDVGRVLGHSQIRTTERYVVVHDDRMHAVAERVGRLIEKTLDAPTNTNEPKE